mmetsp:Transcript_31900/g.51289  ORF Transcript_31900/g.51289 Transcript_31900/m.51289 type:complete len:86 (+) Transcript_31900:165-422(+)
MVKGLVPMLLWCCVLEGLPNDTEWTTPLIAAVRLTDFCNGRGSKSAWTVVPSKKLNVLPKTSSAYLPGFLRPERTQVTLLEYRCW